MKGAAQWIAPRTGSVLVLGGAGLLFLSLWLPWFAVARPCALPTPVECPSGTVHFSAWESFSAADVVFAALALLATVLVALGRSLAVALAPTAGVSPGYAVAIAQLAVAACGWIVVALALWAIHRPGLPVDPSRVPDYGFFLALLAGGAITGGGWWAIGDRSTRDPATRDPA